ncbi:MAG: TetR/AcrR family transcriptional regulator, partial [Actinobacteria bacterium]|nr:TetR/AcrR family transcriptional regulator [Actinomycetota bacterium]
MKSTDPTPLTAKVTDKRRGRPPGSRRREEIVEATMGLVAGRGVQGATITRIASAVGVTEGALYRHFESKEEILKAASAAMRERALQWLHASRNPDVLQRLREIWAAHASYMSGDTHGLFFMPFAFITSDPDLGLREHTRDGHRRNIEVLAAIIDEGIEQGSIRPDVDPRLVAWQFMRLAWAEDISNLMGLDKEENTDVSAATGLWTA